MERGLKCQTDVSLPGFDRLQISLFGILLQLSWWCRQASLTVERRLLRAGVSMVDAQKPKRR
jgi:hypothetical protein